MGFFSFEIGRLLSNINNKLKKPFSQHTACRSRISRRCITPSFVGQFQPKLMFSDFFFKLCQTYLNTDSLRHVSVMHIHCHFLNFTLNRREKLFFWSGHLMAFFYNCMVYPTLFLFKMLVDFLSIWIGNNNQLLTCLFSSYNI